MLRCNMARSINYTKAVVICHGKSEYQISRYIYTNLRLPVKLHAKDKGKHSIQIPGLIQELSTSVFTNIKTFSEHFNVEVKSRNKCLESFKLFTFMDTDDCSQIQKSDYISGKMFSGHWLSDYIVPIYDNPDLENVLFSCGLIPKIFNSNEKGKCYEKIFPINGNSKAEGTIDDIKEFRNKLYNCKNTNIHTMIDYFLGLIAN